MQDSDLRLSMSGRYAGQHEGKYREAYQQAPEPPGDISLHRFHPRQRPGAPATNFTAETEISPNQPQRKCCLGTLDFSWLDRAWALALAESAYELPSGNTKLASGPSQRSTGAEKLADGDARIAEGTSTL